MALGQGIIIIGPRHIGSNRHFNSTSRLHTQFTGLHTLLTVRLHTQTQEAILSGHYGQGKGGFAHLAYIALLLIVKCKLI